MSKSAINAWTQTTLRQAKLLGVLITWDLYGISNVRREDVNKTAADLGVPLVIPIPTPETAARRAVRIAFQRKDGRVPKVVRDDNAVIIWTVLDTANADESKNVGDDAGRVVNRIGFAKGTGVLAFEVEDTTAASVRLAYETTMEMVGADDLRERIMLLVRSWHGFRFEGRVYYVPKGAIAEAQKLREVLRAVKVSFGLIPVPDLGDGAEMIGASAVRQVKADLQQLADEMHRWETDKAPRTSTLESRIGKYLEIKQEIEDLRDVLSVRVDDLSVMLSGLQTSAQKLLNDGEGPVLPGIDLHAAPAPTQAQAAAPDAIPDLPAVQDLVPDSPAEPPKVIVSELGADPTVTIQTLAAPEPAKPVPPAKPKTPAPDFAGLSLDGLKRMAKKMGIRVGSMDRAALASAVETAYYASAEA